jgi:hypothetical protein
MATFSHHDLQLLNPSFNSPLVDVLSELEFLHRLRLEGDEVYTYFYDFPQPARATTLASELIIGT